MVVIILPAISLPDAELLHAHGGALAPRHIAGRMDGHRAFGEDVGINTIDVGG